MTGKAESSRYQVVSRPEGLYWLVMLERGGWEEEEEKRKREGSEEIYRRLGAVNVALFPIG